MNNYSIDDFESISDLTDLIGANIETHKQERRAKQRAQLRDEINALIDLYNNHIKQSKNHGELIPNIK
jgi:hypothetical protein